MSCDRFLPRVMPGETAVGNHHLHLDPQPHLVSAARAFVLQHCPDVPGETRDVLELLTSELVTNAILHAGTPLEVGLTITQESLVVTVHDLDRPSDQPGSFQHREGGWGLGLVSALATDSAIGPHPDGGKTAWFRLPLGALPVVEDGAALRPNRSADAVPPL